MDLKDIIHRAVKDSFEKSGYEPIKPKQPVNESVTPKPQVTEEKKPVGKTLKEALYMIPRTFQLKTEHLSEATKKAHLQLYRAYVDQFNKISSALDASSRQEADANHSEYRSLKLDETYNLNAIKLHELYFHNVSDRASEIATDSIPYMRLARDFGTFENWQFDFMAACSSSREGWAVMVYEPYKDVYMNVVVDSHDLHIPLNTIPVLVMDMWAHSYYKDYENNKDDYVVAMMREINWNVVEARMTLAEKTDLGALYMIQPAYNAVPEGMLDQAVENKPPIQNVDHSSEVAAPPTTPPGPEQGNDY